MQFGNAIWQTQRIERRTKQEISRFSWKKTQFVFQKTPQKAHKDNFFFNLGRVSPFASFFKILRDMNNRSVRRHKIGL